VIEAAIDTVRLAAEAKTIQIESAYKADIFWVMQTACR